jgi:predicted MPP superfamily phosphohydrolase
MFGLPHNIWFWLLMVFFSSFFILALLLEWQYSNQVTRSLSIVSSIWLGFIFIIIFVLLGYDIIRQFVQVAPFQAGQIIIIFSSLVTFLSVVNAKYLRIREVKIPAEVKKKNMKIVHLSDLHIGAIHGIGTLQRIVKKTNALNPDLVLITGDLADGPHRYAQKSFECLNYFNVPVFFTIGNHEYYAGLEYILDILSKTKVKVLRNEMVDLGRIQLVGIDDGTAPLQIKKILKNLQLKSDKYTILMYHRPVGLEEVQDAGVNLMLSGHTHAGQFFPFILFAYVIWKRPRRLYKYKGSYLYVTHGTGTWGPPLRLGTSSEITLIRLIGG